MFDIKIAGFSITSCLGTDYTSLKSGEIKYKYNDNRKKWVIMYQSLRNLINI